MMSAYRMLVLWIAILFFVSFFRYGYAEIEILGYDKFVFFVDEEDVKLAHINFICHKENTTVEEALVKYDSFGFIKATYNGAYYTGVVQIFNLGSGYGNKTITVVCSYSDGSSETQNLFVVVDKFVLEILSPSFSTPLEVFKGEYVTSLKVALKSYFVPVDMYSLRNIKVKVGRYEIENPLIAYENDQMLFIFLIPYEIEEGTYDVSVEGEYIAPTGEVIYLEATSPRSLSVVSPLKVEVISPPYGVPIKLDTSKVVTLSFKVYEKGNEISSLSQSNFRFFLGEKEIEYSLAYDNDRNVYIAKLSLVKDNTKNISLDHIIMRIQNYKKYPIVDFPILEVEYVVSLKGTTLTKEGKIISARFVFSNENRIYEYTSDNKGNFNILIPKGKYNLTLILNNRDKINFYDVVIDASLDSFVKIDYPPLQAEEFRVIKALVVELSSPYNDATAEVYYDDSKVADERHILPLYCDYWNFGLRKCMGEIKKYDFSLNIISNKVYVKNFQKGNIIISEKKRLYISLDMKKKDYYVGEKVEITGYVKDYDGIPQQGVSVAYVLEGSDIKGEVRTNENGMFKVSFLAPSIRDRYEEKEIVFYIPSAQIIAENKTASFTVEKKVKLVGYVDEIVEVYEGEEKDVVITISNEGDLDLTDIEIRVAGLKEDWYVFTPSFIETLRSGSKADIRMRLKIVCGALCKDYYFVNMRIKSREVTEDISFTIKLRKRENINFTKVSQEESKDAFLGKITGKMISIASYPSINYYLIGVFFVLAFLIVHFKKRSKNKHKKILIRRRV